MPPLEFTTEPSSYEVGRDSRRNHTAMNHNAGEGPKSKAANASTSEEEDVERTNNDDGMSDKAAILVLFYLLFIFALLIGAIVIGFFVIDQYGFVVLVAVCAGSLGMFVVAATLASVITRDAKLRKARSKINSWHSTCKVEILKEMENFKEDLAAYRSERLMLTQEERRNDVDQVRGSMDGGEDIERRTTETDDVEDQQPYSRQDKMSTERQPKSLLFSVTVDPLTKTSGRKKTTTSSQRQQLQKQKRRSWKQRSKRNAPISSSRYQPPDVV